MNETSLRIQNHEIKPQQALKYLGMQFDEKLNWSTHISTLIQSVSKITG